MYDIYVFSGGILSAWISFFWTCRVCPTPHGYSEAVRRQRAAELSSSLGLEQVNVGWS